MHESDLPQSRHEATDIGLRVIWIGVPTVVLGVILLAWLVLGLYPGGTVDRTLQLPLPHFPAPELQTDPVADMNRLRQSQQAQLNSTGWIDEQHQFAHVPIDQAFQAVVREGIVDWPADATKNTDAH